MSIKKIKLEEETRKGLKNGVDIIANAVKVTLGPKGQTVIIDRDFGPPIITKDGVTVAKHIFLDDRIENMAAEMVKEVAGKTNDLAGDGTTTTCVLVQSIVDLGIKHISNGVNPVELINSMEEPVSKVLNFLNEECIEINNSSEEILNVATISANNDLKVGQIIADCYKKVGLDGLVAVEEGRGKETYSEIVQGMQFNKGYENPLMSTDTDKMIAEMNEPYFLLFDEKLNDFNPLVRILEQVSMANKEIVIIAEDFKPEVIRQLTINKVNGGLKVVAVKSPGVGDNKFSLLEDIAILTNSKIISKKTGVLLSEINLDDLGTSKKAIIGSNYCSIIDGNGDKKEINK